MQTFVENVGLKGTARSAATHGTDVHHQLIALMSLHVKISILFREGATDFTSDGSVAKALLKFSSTFAR